jgi:hypothetical protein
MSNHVQPNQFGKDHWSMLAYVESVCVDGKQLNHSKMRANSQTHPLLNSTGLKWREDWGTRLADYFIEVNDLWQVEPDEPKREANRLKQHDDWDCLNDLEAAGFVEVWNTTQGAVKMTDMGQMVAAQLRVHKASGGTFASFCKAYRTSVNDVQGKEIGCGTRAEPTAREESVKKSRCTA